MTSHEEQRIIDAFERGETRYNGLPILQALGGLVLTEEMQTIMHEPVLDDEIKK